VGRRPRGLKRFARALVVAGVAAGVFVTAAAALRFTDESYFTPEGVVGQPYSHQFNGASGCGPALPYQYKILNGALPPGLSLSSGGLISGRPTQAGMYSFWVELSDEDPPSQSWCIPAQAEREFSINVLSGISINNQTAKPGTVGQAYSEPLTATTLTSLNPATGTLASTATWSKSSGDLPPGIVLGVDGLLSGTPTTESSYQFVVRAELDPKRWDTETLVIVVRAPVVITLPKVPSSEVGVPFQLKLAATGGTGIGTYTWTLTTGALPQGMALTADGTISGTPRAGGRFAFTATATDTEGRTANYPATLNVAQRLAIATPLLRPAKVGHAYRQKVVTIGGVIPKVLKVTKGPLPRGIRYDRTLGVLSGTPTKPGTYRITFLAMDALKVQSTKTLKLVVTA